MDSIRPILERVAQRTSAVPGICGIVLGGSRARGTHTADSDVDIGLYYASEDTLDLASLGKVAQALDDDHRETLIAPPGGWGHWVNGGGWLVIDGIHVDLILRDLGRVEQAIEDCRAGRVSSHYQTGHPHAYHNVMYMGELAVSRVLWDRDGELARLKALTTPYPPALKKAIVDFFLFEAGFSAMFARENVAKDDLYYVAAHLARSASALNQVLFALNNEYCLNEKKAVRMIEQFSLHPTDYKARIERVFTLLGESPAKACETLGQLIEETKILS